VTISSQALSRRIDIDRPWVRYAVPVLLTLGALLAFGFMRPDRLFVANTPAGGDMGAHVLVPAYIRDTLLPSGRLLGWSNDWYAGFPVLYFYFPLPAFTIVLLDLFVPYGVAFKLVTVAGLVALPFAAYVFARGMGLAKSVSVVAGIAGGTFVFMESFSIFGANTLSTLAGEYSFSWSFALSFAYLGLLMKNVRDGRGFTASTGVLLALTALTHLITTVVVVLVSLPLLFKRRGPTALTGSWLVGFGIAAVWALPLLATVSYTTDMRWFPVTGFEAVFPRELWPVLVLAGAGLVYSIWRRATLGPVLALLVLPVAGYFVIQYVDFRKLYNARLLPFWFFTVFLLAGVAVGAAAKSISQRVRGGPEVRWTAAAVGVVFFLTVAGLGVDKAPKWASWNYSGYETKAAYAFGEDGKRILQTDYWAEYSGLMATLDSLPEGRVMWEANSDLNRYGTPMALMLTGYWAEGHPSMEGLLFESSLTTPFHFINASEVSQRPSNPIPGLPYSGMNFERAVKHLAVYDVEYYVSFTESATQAADAFGLDIAAVSEPFTVFRLPTASLVDIASYEPAVWDGAATFVDAAIDWYDEVEGLDRWIVEDGPTAWRRIDDVSLRSRDEITTSGVVTDIVLDDHRISFSTTAVGVPHLVKVSWFPNWSASGADGPYRAAPSLMIVVPTQRDVVIDFKERLPETAGKAISAATILALGTAGFIRRRGRRLALPSGDQ
jgi:hypothetical protein